MTSRTSAGRASLTRLLWCLPLICAAALLSACSDRGGSKSEAGSPYTLGSKVRFGSGGDGTKFLGAGWSSPETGHTWSDKNSAVLLLKLEPTSEPLTVRMQLSGLKKAPELPFQPVEVFANGTKIADWEVGDEGEHTATVPAENITTGPLRLELKIPKATTPKQLGMGNDERVLGVSIHALQIDKGPK